MFLLDTNVLSEAAKPSPNPKVLAWLGAVDEDRLFLSAVSIAEIRHGIALLDDGKKRKQLAVWLEKELLHRFAKKIIPVDESTALAWGDLMGLAKRLGRPLATLDGFIAATATSKKLTLVTRNKKDFDFLGFPVLNPWDE